MSEPDIRRVLHVRFVPLAEANADDAAAAIHSNRFFFTEIGPNDFLVMTPHQHYGGEREMSDDLNENATHGRYEVSVASEAELRDFDRNDGHLHN